MVKKRRRRGYHRGDYVSTKSGETFSYRSGWEEKYMVWLDGREEVLSWRHEPFTIGYISNIRSGKTRKYHPDFIVEYSDRTELIEIKPSRKVGQRLVQKKVAAAEDWCLSHGVSFRIITEIELKELGLL
jgi:hypothetical protein